MGNRKRRIIALAVVLPLLAIAPAASATATVNAGSSHHPGRPDRPDRPDRPGRPDRPPIPPPPGGTGEGRTYPWHTNINMVTFWVGEIFDPDAADGSQMLSTYDEDWFAHYGGCDGVETRNTCETERRTAANGYYPTSMTPRENPFYVDVPYDDLNNPAGFNNRTRYIPWANDPGYAGHARDTNFSYLKNRWVQLTHDGRTCYAQIEDAGPGRYFDHEYVFGANDARPQNRRYGRAGMDVSPAVTGCLGFADINGVEPGVSWRFVDAVDVPAGPWKRLVTTSPVNN